MLNSEAFLFFSWIKRDIKPHDIFTQVPKVDKENPALQMRQINHSWSFINNDEDNDSDTSVSVTSMPTFVKPTILPAGRIRFLYRNAVFSLF